MFLFSAFIATIPIIPFTLFSGLMGAKYGLVVGALVNWFGRIISSAIYFLSARYFFTDFFSVYLKRFKGIDKFQRMIQKNAFVAIFIARTIPVIPPPVVNIYSGVVGIAFLTYISSLPKLLISAIFYLIFLIIIILFYKTWFNRRLHN